LSPPLPIFFLKKMRNTLSLVHNWWSFSGSSLNIHIGPNILLMFHVFLQILPIVWEENSERWFLEWAARKSVESDLHMYAAMRWCLVCSTKDNRNPSWQHLAEFSNPPDWWYIWAIQRLCWHAETPDHDLPDFLLIPVFTPLPNYKPCVPTTKGGLVSHSGRPASPSGWGWSLWLTRLLGKILDLQLARYDIRCNCHILSQSGLCWISLLNFIWIILISFLG
jgi:hypothetical protein